MAEVGTAHVSVIPDAKGFGNKLSKDVSKDTKTSGSKIGKLLGGTVGKLFTGTAIIGGIGKSISLAKDFDLTMRQVGVQTGQTGKGLKTMSDLALKMGADTAFSAKDASDAMLELSKGGMTAAQIKAGALKTTLTLAAAGGLKLGDAAGFVVQGMTTFGLKATQAKQVAVALAGGANASTASVESLGQALSQVGPGAKNAGLSIQETVATLAAFDNAGIKGSDAGTSLKTMLTRLVPQTDKASTAMDAFGLSFVDGKGNIDDISTVAEKLKNKLGGLSQAERTTALAQIFGSDATRAATVLMNNGRAGMEKYIKATKNQATVQKMANTAMGGASGAWNNFTGSVETLAIKVGQQVLPAFTKIGNAAAKFIGQMTSGSGAGGRLATVLGKVATVVGKVLGFIVNNIGPFGTFVGIIGTVVAAVRIWVGVQAALNFVLSANPIGIVVIAIAALAGGLVYAYQHSETFRKIVDAAFRGIAAAAKFMWNGVVQPALKLMIQMFGAVAGVWAHVLKALSKVPGFGWLKPVAKGLQNVSNNAVTLAGKIHKIPDRHDTKVTANTSAASAAVAGFINTTNNKTATIDVHANIAAAAAAVAGVGHNAAGTNFWRGGPSWVGEHGPEIVNLPRGARVTPNNEIAAGASGGVMILRVDGRDFRAYVEDRADSRVGAHARLSRETIRSRR